MARKLLFILNKESSNPNMSIVLKNTFKKMKELFDDLEYEWFTYTHLRKFARLNRKLAGK